MPTRVGDIEEGFVTVDITEEECESLGSSYKDLDNSKCICCIGKNVYELPCLVLFILPTLYVVYFVLQLCNLVPGVINSQFFNGDTMFKIGVLVECLLFCGIALLYLGCLYSFVDSMKRGKTVELQRIMRLLQQKLLVKSSTRSGS